MTEDIRDKMTAYNSEAIDGDNDGILQDGTVFERPVGTTLEDLKLEETEELKVEENIIEDVQENLISSPEPVEDTVPALSPVADGVMGSTKVKKTPTTKKPVAKLADAADAKTVALYSTRNVVWQGVGKVQTGYNIVTKDQAEKWAARDHIRLVDPTEVAQELGK